jgi:hypothetical protein
VVFYFQQEDFRDMVARPDGCGMSLVCMMKCELGELLVDGRSESRDGVQVYKYPFR